MISNELLKKKILDEAIHGRLIENDPSLKPIDVESINDDIPFEIPNNWKWAKFSNLAECRMGKTILAENLTDNGIPVYSATQENKIFGFVKNSELVLHRGDIVIPARGNSIGYATYILDKEATCTQTTICCQNIKILSKYLYFCCYAFKSLWFHFTGAAIPQITVKQLNKNLVPLPPLEEQEKIVKKIEELFELIDKKEKNDQEKGKLKTLLKEKILDSAIHGELVENDLTLPTIDNKEIKEDIPFEIPSNWVWKKMSDCYMFKQGVQINIDKQSLVKSETTPLQFLRIVDFTQNNNDIRYVSNEYNSYILNKNELAIVRYGASAGFVCLGKTGVLANNLFKLIPQITINVNYMFNFLNSSYFQSKVRTHSVAMPSLKFASLNKIMIAIPPLEQQKKIVEKIEECFKLIEQL